MNSYWYDKEDYEDVLSEGLGYAIREGWLKPDHIADNRLAALVSRAQEGLDTFFFAAQRAEERLKDVLDAWEEDL